MAGGMLRLNDEEFEGLRRQQFEKCGIKLPRLATRMLEGEESDEGPESDLQKKIVAWCKNKGHPCLSLRQSKNARGYILAGWPDLVIIMPQTQVVFIELKSGKGRLSDDQKMMNLQFLSHGHVIHCVRSYKRFLEIMEA